MVSLDLLFKIVKFRLENHTVFAHVQRESHDGET